MENLTTSAANTSVNMTGISAQGFFKNNLSRKEKKGLSVIRNHSGKNIVFETYLKMDLQKAMKYLRFISRNPGARYVLWDLKKQDFVNAS